MLKPNFKHLKIFDENLVAIHMKRTNVVFNKLVSCGISMLDISKTLMLTFLWLHKEEVWRKSKTVIHGQRL